MIKIILVGDVAVGKSSLMERYVDNVFKSDLYMSTIGIDFKLFHTSIDKTNTIDLQHNPNDISKNEKYHITSEEKKIIKNYSFSPYPHSPYILSYNTININNKSIDNNKNYYKIQIWDTAGQERFKSITQNYYRGSHIIIVCFDVSAISGDGSMYNVSKWLNELVSSDHVDNNTHIYILGTRSDNLKSFFDIDDFVSYLNLWHSYKKVRFIGVCSSKYDSYYPFINVSDFSKKIYNIVNSNNHNDLYTVSIYDDQNDTKLEFNMNIKSMFNNVLYDYIQSEKEDHHSYETNISNDITIRNIQLNKYIFDDSNNSKNNKCCSIQ